MKRKTPIKHPVFFWNMHVDAWHVSGLSQSDYCRRHGLRVKAFGHHKIRRQGTDNKLQPCKALTQKLDLVALPVSLISAANLENLNNSSGISIALGRKCRLDIEPGFDSICLAAVLKLVVAL